MAAGESSWPVESEIFLFQAMRKHKPVGVQKHFQMMFIHEKLNRSISKTISASQIWKHLGEMYDLNALNESEIIPFPNKEKEFTLPEDILNEGDSTLSDDVADKSESASSSIAKTPKSSKGNTDKLKEDAKDSPSSPSPAPKRDGRKRTRGNVEKSADHSGKRSRRT